MGNTVARDAAQKTVQTTQLMAMLEAAQQRIAELERKQPSEGGDGA